MSQCLKLDPKLGDLTIVRIIKVRTGYRCKDIRRTMVSIVKDKSDLDSWFSAKPIIVGNLSYILAGTELNLRQDVINFLISIINQLKINIFFCIYREVVETLSVSMQTRNGKDESLIIRVRNLIIYTLDRKLRSRLFLILSVKHHTYPWS